MIGQSIAHYTITEKIGEGGMGEVYRATDSKLKHKIQCRPLRNLAGGEQHHDENIST